MAFTRLHHSLPQNLLSHHTSVQAPGVQHLHGARKQSLGQLIRSKKKVFPTQKPFGEATAAGGEEPCLHFSSAIGLLLQEKALPARGLLLCPLSLRVFPSAGQGAKPAQQAPLAAAGVPRCAGLPPQCLGY